VIVGLLELYESVVSLSIAISIGYILYSGDFVVIHRAFLFRFGIGAGLSGLLQAGLLLLRPSAVELAHVPPVFFLLAGLVSIIRGYPVHEESWFDALFRA
jgi:hypothetical protein